MGSYSPTTTTDTRVDVWERERSMVVRTRTVRKCGSTKETIEESVKYELIQEGTFAADDIEEDDLFALRDVIDSALSYVHKP